MSGGRAWFGVKKKSEEIFDIDHYWFDNVRPML
jgi:hypothetical protein